MSVCKGKIINLTDLSEQIKVFREQSVTFEQFSANPSQILNDENLLIKIDERVYDKNAAIPVILSFLIYNKALPEATIQSLRN